MHHSVRGPLVVQGVVHLPPDLRREEISQRGEEICIVGRVCGGRRQQALIVFVQSHVCVHLRHVLPSQCNVLVSAAPLDPLPNAPPHHAASTVSSRDLGGAR